MNKNKFHVWTSITLLYEKGRIVNMELEKLINELIEIINDSKETDDYFINRYNKIKEELIEMLYEIRNSIYPSNYNALPTFHLIDSNADNSKIYEKMCEINDWYLSNYRSKDEVVLTREMVCDYLCNECHMSEKRAKNIIKDLGRHKDIYYEFVYYVKNKHFSQDSIIVEGYTAEHLYNNYHLSVIGAYNYLVYLLEEPNQALADLKEGLPRK